MNDVTLLLLAPLLVGCAAPAAAPAAFTPALPAFALEDPRGTRHERDALLAEGGLLLVVTAPILAAGDAQEAWNDALAAAAPSGGRWLLVEDVSQSSFPGTALDRMREEFDPARPPLLLLDQDGALRTGLGVAEEATVVLVYDAKGALVHSDATEASTAGAASAWKALAATE